MNFTPISLPNVKPTLKGLAELYRCRVHRMNRSQKPFRLILVRPPYQQGLFGQEDMKRIYTAIATNRMDSAETVINWYYQRSECSENRIKELKIGFGMERMPCGQTVANAVSFRIGAMSYKICRLFVLKS